MCGGEEQMTRGRDAGTRAGPSSQEARKKKVGGTKKTPSIN